MNHQYHMIKELKQNRPRRAEEHAKLIWHLKTGGVPLIPKHCNFDRLEKSEKIYKFEAPKKRMGLCFGECRTKYAI